MSIVTIALSVAIAILISVIVWQAFTINRFYTFADITGQLSRTGKHQVTIRGSKRDIEFSDYCYSVVDRATGVSASYDGYYSCPIKSKLEAIKRLEDKLVAHAIDTAPHLNEALPHRKEFKSIVENVNANEQTW